MIERKYFTLLQEQLDTTLPLAQQCALQGYLDGNSQAARLSESLIRLANGCDDLTLPENFVPADPKSLHTAITSAVLNKRGGASPVIKWVLLLFKNSSKKEHEHKSAQWRMHKMKREAQREIQGETFLQKAAPKKALNTTEQIDVNLAEKIRKRLTDMKSGEFAGLEAGSHPSLVSNTGPVRAEAKAAASPVPSLTGLAPISPIPLGPEFDSIFHTAQTVFYPVHNESVFPTPREETTRASVGGVAFEWSPSWPPVPSQEIANKPEQRHTHTHHVAAHQVGLPTQPPAPPAFDLGPRQPISQFPAAEQAVPQLREEHNYEQENKPAVAPGVEDHQERMFRVDPAAFQLPTENPTPKISAVASRSASASPAPSAVPERGSAMSEPPPGTVILSEAKELESESYEPVILSEAKDLKPESNERATEIRSSKANVIPVAEISNFIDILFREPDRPIPQNPQHPQPEENAVDKSLFDSGSWEPLDSLTRSPAFSKLNMIDNSEIKSGHITSLGPFLIDKQSEDVLEALITSGVRHMSARILTEDESTELKNCLAPLKEQDGVAGCVIIGYDGMVVANTLPQSWDPDLFSAMALMTYMSSHSAIQMLGHQRLRQIVSRSTGGIVLLADFGEGLLLVVSDKTTNESVLPLMRGARKVTAA